MRRWRSLVLCYHAISEAWHHPLALKPEALDAQLSALIRRGFRPATSEQVLANDGKLLHVTFDDAFRSLARGLPVLERLDIPATVFVCPSFADGGRPLAVRELEDAVAQYPGELDTMSWEELMSISARGFTIGSHTLSHAHLTGLSDGELDRELRTSRERIEDQLERPCKLLAYPYGEYNSRVRAAARSAGYEAAFILSPSPRPPDRYAVPRVGIWRRDGLFRVMLKASPTIRHAVDRARTTRVTRARGDSLQVPPT